MRYDDVIDRYPVLAAPDSDDLLPCVALRLGRTKTAGAEQDERVILIGRPVTAVKIWIALAGIRKGALFRAIDRFGRLGTKPLDPQSVNAILKKRCALAGLPVTAFSAHGLRSGYLSEAARRSVPIQEAMRQSRHRSVQQASDYYNEVEIERGLRRAIRRSVVSFCIQRRHESASTCRAGQEDPASSEGVVAYEDRRR